MGVKHLWYLLQTVKHEEDISCLKGKCLAVDLSMWMCQALETQGLSTAVKKPHLRNLFYRVLCLQKQGINLLFVTDGEPPELKHAKVLQRLHNRNHDHRNKTVKQSQSIPENSKYKGRKGGRFEQLTKECCLMLECLGIPVLRSDGEAEATCARLNQLGIVDGCITDDSDAFLFGAKVVYRDLRTTNKDHHVYRYEMEEIYKELGLNQTDLIAIALLVGCDYCDGISGIGRMTVKKLIDESKDVDLLKKFHDWKKKNFIINNATTVEKTILRKLKDSKNFPSVEVAMEFLCPMGAVSVDEKTIPQQTYPQITSLKDKLTQIVGYSGTIHSTFCFDNLEWPGDYTQEKTLPLVTRQFITRVTEGKNPNFTMKPSMIESICQRNHVAMYSVRWCLDEEAQKLIELNIEFFSTLESQLDIIMNFPNLPMTESLQKKISTKNKLHAKQQLKQASKTQEKDIDTKRQTSDEIKSKNAYLNVAPETVIEGDYKHSYASELSSYKLQVSEIPVVQKNILSDKALQSNVELSENCKDIKNFKEETLSKYLLNDKENISTNYNTLSTKEHHICKLPITDSINKHSTVMKMEKELQSDVASTSSSDNHTYLPLMARMKQKKMQAQLKQ